MAPKSIWSVLIGIGNTAPPEEEVWTGSKRDIQRVYDYLIKRGTNQLCIKRLEDGEATREAILATIQAHLISNDNIQRDDPILIYYSGHGTQLTAPEGWPVDGPDRRMEAIVTYNCLLPEDDPAREYVIPDRTITALFRELHSKRGNNITFILDCCHSGHMNRDGNMLPDELRFRPRNLNASWLKVAPDTDADIWGPIEQKEFPLDDQPRQRGAILHHEYDTHVLLAACKQDEIAENNPMGGIFTHALLLALADGEDITYNQLKGRIAYHYHQLWNLYRDAIDQHASHITSLSRPFQSHRYPTKQTPQCIGLRTHRNRLLWKAVGDTDQRFIVELAETTPTGTPQCRISAGELAGVQIGTSFHIITTSKTGDQARTYPVFAVKVERAWCFCDLPSDIEIEPANIHAVIVSATVSCQQYWVERTGLSPAAADCDTHLKQLLEKYAEESDLVAVLAQSKESANITLEVGEEGVLVHRRDPLFLRLQVVSPRISFDDVKRIFPQAFRSLARFHSYLTPHNNSSFITAQVELNLHVLEPAATDVGWMESDPIREVGDKIPFNNDEAVLHSSEEGLDHALTLRNHSDTDLFPYVFWFDTATYSITLMYSPLNDDDPPLRKLSPVPTAADAPRHTQASDEEFVPGYLQIGGSRECGGPITLYVPPGMARDVGFVKVFLADSPLDLSSMEQLAVLGLDDDGEPNIMAFHESSDAPLDMFMRTCGSITKAVTVVSTQDAE